MFKQINYLRQDLKTWECKRASELLYLLLEAGVWAVVVYRIGRFLLSVRLPVLNILCRLASLVLFKFSEAFLGVSLPPGVAVGSGLHIGHTGLIVINYGVKIGKNFTMTHGVTIGTLGIGKLGAPEIGNDVFVGAGAKILGKIKVGDRARIGANAVVVKDVPDNATAVGVPARVIRK
jgi:serine O-acetyltransferase